MRPSPLAALLTAILLAGPLGAPALAGPWPDLGRAPVGGAEAAGRNDAALIVAIEDYAHVPDVPGARRNAADWRAWLRARGVRSIKMLADAEAMHGFDATGKPAGILSALEQTAARVKPGGTLWFVFIGHGAPNGDPANPDGLLLAQGVQQSADGLRLQGIPVNSQLMPRLRPRAPNARAVAVLDACFSGRDTRGSAVVPGLQPVFVASPAQVPAGVTLLSAARGDQFAGPLPGMARPAFSYLALGALRGWADANGDRSVTAGEVHTYVEDALFRLVTGRTQTPEVRGETDGPLAAALEAGPDLNAIADGLAGRGAAAGPTRPTPTAPPPVAARPNEGATPTSAVPQRLSRQQILGVIRESAARVRRCHDPNGPSGTITVKLTVQPDGRVAAAHVTTTKLKGTTTAACVEEEVRAFRFPAFGGEAMEFNMPLAL